MNSITGITIIKHFWTISIDFTSFYNVETRSEYSAPVKAAAVFCKSSALLPCLYILCHCWLIPEQCIPFNHFLNLPCHFLWLVYSTCPLAPSAHAVFQTSILNSTWPLHIFLTKMHNSQTSPANSTSLFIFYYNSPLSSSQFTILPGFVSFAGLEIVTFTPSPKAKPVAQFKNNNGRWHMSLGNSTIHLPSIQK